jgi:iron complex transport system permease protein
MTSQSGKYISRARPRLSDEEAVLPAVRPIWGRIGLGMTVLIAVTGLALVSGAATIPPAETLRILIAAIPGVNVEVTGPASWERIVLDIRLPRVLLAGLVGATLAYAGATYQGVLRNPLADPYLIGVAAGAGLGATIAFVVPISIPLPFFNLVALFSFIGAITAVTVAYRLARIGTRVPSTTLILAGVAISSLASAATMFLYMMSDDNLRSIFSWIMGSLNTATWDRVWLLLPYTVVMAVVVLAHARVLNVLQLNEEQAQHLGVNVERVKLILIGSASLATAIAVSVSGLIGFVGLVVPHMIRLLWGPDYRPLLPLAMIYGAAFLILSDLIARTVISPGELPVGVITAFFGAPFFLYLLRRARLTYF